MTETNSSLERLRLWLGFFKTVVVSGAVAIIIVILNNQITTLQLELEDRRAEQELDLHRLEIENGFLSQFVQEALSENLERRRRFAHYFAVLTGDNESRNRWQVYLAEVDAEFGQTTNALNQRIAELEAAQNDSGVSESMVQELTSEIRRLEAEVRPRESVSIDDMSHPANYGLRERARRVCTEQLQLTEREIDEFKDVYRWYVGDSSRLFEFLRCSGREFSKMTQQ